MIVSSYKHRQRITESFLYLSDLWEARLWPHPGSRVPSLTITIIYPKLCEYFKAMRLSQKISSPLCSRCGPGKRAQTGPKKPIMVFRMIHLSPVSWTVHSFFYHHWITPRWAKNHFSKFCILCGRSCWARRAQFIILLLCFNGFQQD